MRENVRPPVIHWSPNKQQAFMKKPTLVIFLAVPACLCLGQGHVDFANDPSLFVDDPSTARFVSCIEGGRLTGANWVAQLWYGTGSGLEAITMAAEPVAHFYAAGAGPGGTWAGGDITLPGTSPGETLNLEVRV